MDFWEEIYVGLRQAIFSMSEHLQTIGFRLRDKRDVIIEHFIKLFYFRDSQWELVWKRSIFSAVARVPAWKKHKFPSKDFVYSCLWKEIEDVWHDQFDNWLDSVSQGLDDRFLNPRVMLENPRPDEVGHIVQIYCFWLSQELASHGQVSSADVYDLIDDLLERYPFNPS